MFRPILAAAAIAFALPAFAQTAPTTAPATTDATPSTMSAPAAAPTAKAPEVKTSDAKSSSVASKDKVALAGKTGSRRHHHHKVTDGKQLAKNEAKPATTGAAKTSVTK
jgi:hypothetical protein